MKKKINAVCSHLEKTGYGIMMAQTTTELEEVCKQKLSFRLAIMTDSFHEKLCAGLLDVIKRQINPDKMICLSRDENQNNELMLRSSGLIFFGSYETFLMFADKIIN